jgi:hypothetical protein
VLRARIAMFDGAPGAQTDGGASGVARRQGPSCLH